ncbi:MAG: DNA-binding response regulator [Ponticaulis sp.]|nr:DNA-binding response regulator [Ponticaulis sp.]
MSSSSLTTQSPKVVNQAISAIIIDDEPLAHDVLLHHIQAHNQTANGQQTRSIDIKSQVYNATDALKWLSENVVDLIFLDIKMPLLTGIDLVKVLANRPQIVFVTAYQEHAVTAFELDVTDYLVKPVSLSRLQQAIGKVSQRLTLSNTRSTQNAESYVMLNLSGTKRKVFTRDIQWFEAYGNYVKVWLKDEMLMANSTFKQLLDSLPHIDLLNAALNNTVNQYNEGMFAQIHKSYGVNLGQAKALAGDHLVMMDDTQIKIGKTFKKALKQRFR